MHPGANLIHCRVAQQLPPLSLPNRWRFHALLVGRLVAFDIVASGTRGRNRRGAGCCRSARIGDTQHHTEQLHEFACMLHERRSLRSLALWSARHDKCTVWLREKAHTYAKSRSDVARRRWHPPAYPLPVVTFSVFNAPSMLTWEDGQEREKSEEQTLQTVSANCDHAQQSRIWCFGKLKLSLLYQSTTFRQVQEVGDLVQEHSPGTNLIFLRSTPR